MNSNPMLNRLNKSAFLGREQGLTLLELMFSITILLVLSIGSVQMIRQGVDVQLSLSEDSRVHHRLDVAMSRIVYDLEHAFAINRRRIEYSFDTRRMKAYFAIKTRRDASELKFTTMTNRPLVREAAESDQTYIVYRTERDNDTGITHLYRGQTSHFLNRFNQDPEMKILAKAIKSIKIEAWNGTSWVENWDNEKSDFRDKIPHMVKIQVEAFAIDPVNKGVLEDSGNQPVKRLSTIVYLANSQLIKEPKQRNSSPKYL